MLRQIGLNVTLKNLPFKDWHNIASQPLDRTRTQIVDQGWAADYLDPQDYVTLLLRCGQAYDVGGYCNKTFESLVDRADVEPNIKARVRLYIEAQHVALSQGAFISRVNVLSFELLKPYVHGLVGSAAYPNMMPRDLDWANVSIDRH